MNSEDGSGTDVSQQFGEAVRRRRLALAMSQEELADLSGLHRTYISDVERATRNVTLKTAARLAAALRVSLPMLLETPLELE